jgi:hypothetical protein
MRIRANIWHLIGRLYQPAAWRIFTTKSVQALVQYVERILIINKNTDNYLQTNINPI